VTVTRIVGIPVKVHPSFLLLVAAFFLFQRFSPDGNNTLLQSLLIASLFLFVLLHELGHALAAKYFKIQTKDITLYPFGGIARISQKPKNCWEDLVISFAGPATNFLIAALIFPFDFLFAVQFVRFLLIINIVMGVFNLLPIYPMDGGRILNAILQTVFNEEKAKKISIQIGLCLSLMIFLTGIFFIQNPGLIFISAVLFFMLMREVRHLNKINA